MGSFLHDYKHFTNVLVKNELTDIRLVTQYQTSQLDEQLEQQSTFNRLKSKYLKQIFERPLGIFILKMVFSENWYEINNYYQEKLEILITFPTTIKKYGFI